MVSYSDINVWAILVAAVASMALGMLYYSPIAFGRTWMDLIGKRPEDLGSPTASYMLSGLGTLLAATALSVIAEAVGATTAILGLGFGALVGVGFIAPVLATDYVYAGRSIHLYLLNVAYHVLSFILMGAIIGAWQ